MPQNGHTFQLLRGTSTLDLTDLVNYAVVAFDGVGMSPTRRLTQRGPQQHGDSDVGFRLDPRTIVLSVLASGATDAALIADREQMLGMLRPGNDAIKLRWTYPDGRQRQIDTHYSGQMSLPSRDWRLNHHRIAFELRASDPTWYDPAGGSVQFAQTGGGTAMPVPMLFPLTFGASTLSASEVINLSAANAWDTFPIIYATGPVTNLVITNGATGEKIDFTGNSIGSGVTYTIDLRYGYKTVIDSTNAPRIDQVTSDSNIATFRLVPGINTITATGTSIDANTRISIQYNARYIGV